jgi:biotin carboxyl carrier protein
MQWLIETHRLTFGTPSQEATSHTMEVNEVSLHFRLDRTLRTVYRQEMREGFLVETPYPIRRWERDPQTGGFVCEVRLDGQYRTLYSRLRPAAIETLLQQATHCAASATILSPMTGRVLRIGVALGEVVHPGHVLAVLDAMKMENNILSKQIGTIEKIHISTGENIQKGTPLFTFSAS